MIEMTTNPAARTAIRRAHEARGALVRSVLAAALGRLRRRGPAPRGAQMIFR